MMLPLFIALSYDIVWFRLLSVIMRSTAFTFGTLLVLHLASDLGLQSGARHVSVGRV